MSETNRTGMSALEREFLTQKRDGLIPSDMGWGEWNMRHELIGMTIDRWFTDQNITQPPKAFRNHLRADIGDL